MRDIKFRAWNEGKMLENVFVHDSMMIIKDLEGEETFGKTVPLMQFTGLRDKNGVDIYEGDIVIIKEITLPSRTLIVNKAVVGWDYNAWIVESVCGHYHGDIRNAKSYEVIGNIYENSELLKEV